MYVSRKVGRNYNSVRSTDSRGTLSTVRVVSATLAHTYMLICLYENKLRRCYWRRDAAGNRVSREVKSDVAILVVVVVVVVVLTEASASCTLPRHCICNVPTLIHSAALVVV